MDNKNNQVYNTTGLKLKSKQKEEHKICDYPAGRLSWNYCSLYFCDEPL